MSSDPKFSDMDFSDLEPKEVRFSVLGGSYVLREPDAEAGSWRRTELVNRTEVEVVETEDGRTEVRPKRISGTGDLEIEFLSRCIFPVECTDGVSFVVSDKHISLDVLKKWPDRIVSRLLNKLEEMTDSGNPTSPPSEGQGDGAES